MSKSFKKAENNRHLKKLVESGLSIEDISGSFGTTVGATQKWINGEPCPYWTKIASEGIMRRLGLSKQSTLLIRCPSDQEGNITTIAISLGATVTSIKL